MVIDYVVSLGSVVGMPCPRFARVTWGKGWQDEASPQVLMNARYHIAWVHNLCHSMIFLILFWLGILISLCLKVVEIGLLELGSGWIANKICRPYSKWIKEHFSLYGDYLQLDWSLMWPFYLLFNKILKHEEPRELGGDDLSFVEVYPFESFLNKIRCDASVLPRSQLIEVSLFDFCFLYSNILIFTGPLVNVMILS